MDDLFLSRQMMRVCEGISFCLWTADSFFSIKAGTDKALTDNSQFWCEMAASQVLHH